MPDESPATALGVGSRVLTPDLDPDTIEEIDQSDGMVRVRYVAMDGGPSCLSSWYADISALRPLPAGFVRPEPTPEFRAEAVAFWRQIEGALERLADD